MLKHLLSSKFWTPATRWGIDAAGAGGRGFLFLWKEAEAGPKKHLKAHAHYGRRSFGLLLGPWVPISE